MWGGYLNMEDNDFFQIPVGESKTRPLLSPNLLCGFPDGKWPTVVIFMNISLLYMQLLIWL